MYIYVIVRRIFRFLLICLRVLASIVTVHGSGSTLRIPEASKVRVLALLLLLRAFTLRVPLLCSVHERLPMQRHRRQTHRKEDRPSQRRASLRRRHRHSQSRRPQELHRRGQTTSILVPRGWQQRMFFFGTLLAVMLIFGALEMFEGTYAPPEYNPLYGFEDGAQVDIFTDEPGFTGNPPASNAAAAPVVIASGTSSLVVVATTAPAPAPTPTTSSRFVTIRVTSTSTTMTSSAAATTTAGTGPTWYVQNGRLNGCEKG